MTPDELIAILAAATEDQRIQIQEKIDPSTKAASLKKQLAAKFADINAGTARARDLVQNVLNQVEGGDLNVVIPLNADIRKAFAGT